MIKVYTKKAFKQFVGGRPWLKLTLTIPKKRLALHRMSTVLNICEKALEKSGRYEVFSIYEETCGEHSFYVVESNFVK